MEGTTPDVSSRLPAEGVPECPRCRLLEARLLELETKLRDLEDRVKGKPPKRPMTPLPPAPAKKPTGQKRGAQPGHEARIKKFLPSERVNHVVAYIPEQCSSCDQPLSAEASPNDPEPTRHQVAELPPIRATITEHQGHYRTCVCGCVNHAAIPAAVRSHSVGPDLTAAMSYLVGCHGVSKRGTEEIVESLFDVPIALGTIANLEREMSDALVSPYEQARKSVAEAEVKHLDETGWNEGGKKRWLWVAATATAVLFLIHPRRNFAALELLLGRRVGILISDRWNVYDHWDEECRQLCWAHVKRNWDKQIERGGKAKTLGCQWLDHQKTVFELWHRFKSDKAMSRNELQLRLEPTVDAMGELLHAGIRSRDAKLSRFCESLLDRWPMYWLFTWKEGVEPTNNHAERVQRRAVLWRRKSFGCQSSTGCRFVERILTVVQTLRLQQRNAYHYLSQCLTAHRAGTPTPALV
jgi:transposase